MGGCVVVCVLLTTCPCEEDIGLVKSTTCNPKPLSDVFARAPLSRLRASERQRRAITETKPPLTRVVLNYGKRNPSDGATFTLRRNHRGWIPLARSEAAGGNHVRNATSQNMETGWYAGT